MLVLDCGLQHYRETLQLQHRLVEARQKALVPDILIVVEHHPIITLGKRAGRQSLRVAPEAISQRGIEVIAVERGGDATFHAPGQLVVYPLFLLPGGGRGVKAFVRALEEVMIQVLGAWGIPGSRNDSHPGVWVGDAKIGSVGIAVRHSVSFHGFALNINNDLSGFEVIYPCGMRDARITSAERYLGTTLPMEAVREVAVEKCAGVFGSGTTHVFWRAGHDYRGPWPRTWKESILRHILPTGE